MVGVNDADEIVGERGQWVEPERRAPAGYLRAQDLPLPMATPAGTGHRREATKTVSGEINVRSLRNLHRASKPREKASVSVCVQCAQLIDLGRGRGHLELWPARGLLDAALELGLGDAQVSQPAEARELS